MLDHVLGTCAGGREEEASCGQRDLIIMLLSSCGRHKDEDTDKLMATDREALGGVREGSTWKSSSLNSDALITGLSVELEATTPTMP